MADVIYDISPAVIQSIAPELTTKLSDEAWADIITFANEFDLSVSVCESVSTARFAKILLAAHLGTMMARAGGPVGPVTSEAAGGIRRSYGFMAWTDGAGLGLTGYGMQLITLLSMSFAMLPVVG